MGRYEIYPTAIGNILIAEEGGRVTNLCLAESARLTGMERGETPLLKEAAEKLRAYLSGEAHALTGLPLSPKGTPFQQRVWQALLAIPYGQTRSYKQVAEAVGNPKAVRAVGSANARNPIFIAIPCHRVVGADGSLTGFAYGVELKRRLLELERRA